MVDEATLEAQKCLVGAALVDALRVVPLAQEAGVRPEDFAAPWDTVWGAVCDLAGSAGGAVDAVLVAERCRALGSPVAAAVLDECVDGCPTAAHAAFYADLVHSAALRERVASACAELCVAARQAERGEQALALASERIAGLVGGMAPAEASNGEEMDGLVEVWERVARGEGPAVGLGTPWPELTRLLCGFEPGMVVLAGRQSDGKTTLEDQLLTHLAHAGVPVGRFTLDATRRELLARSICREAGVSLPKLKFGFGGKCAHNMARVREAVARLRDLPVWIDDRTRDVRGIAATMRRWKLRHGVKVVSVDYVQQVRAEELGRREFDANCRLTLVTGLLKAVALELGMTVVLLSQLRRMSPTEKWRPPAMTDLKDSGSLEQEADKILAVYSDRPALDKLEAEVPDVWTKCRPTYVEVLKHKNGEVGALPFWLLPAYFRFVPAAEADVMEDGTWRLPERSRWGKDVEVEV